MDPVHNPLWYAQFECGACLIGCIHSGKLFLNKDVKKCCDITSAFCTCCERLLVKSPVSFTAHPESCITQAPEQIAKLSPSK